MSQRMLQGHTPEVWGTEAEASWALLAPWAPRASETMALLSNMMIMVLLCDLEEVTLGKSLPPFGPL